VEEPVYELLGWEHRIIPDTEEDLGFDVDPAGKNNSWYWMT
jgi:type III polyketide synthase